MKEEAAVLGLMEIFLDFIESFLCIRVSLVDVLNDGLDFLGISGFGCFARRDRTKQQQNDKKKSCAASEKTSRCWRSPPALCETDRNGRRIFDLISVFPAPCEALLNLSSHHLLCSLYETCMFL